MYIENLKGPEDLKNLGIKELESLAEEMRQALIIRASKHKGHVGPDLGFIEASIALHYVFNSPLDKIVYDVSHQTYPHKMLTGRQDAYLYEEKYDDVSAYSNPKESDHDFFEIGHTSTSIDLAAGMAKARDLKGDKYNVIAVIGDGSLSGGEALEGLNIAGEFDSNFIILVNDNQMSIAENHGGLYKNLQALREGNGKASTNLFTAMGLDYCYLEDGNNIEKLIEVLSKVKDRDKPVVVHINTLKGKGYKPAEDNKERWHWSLPFDLQTGEVKAEYRSEGESYQRITAQYLLKKMEADKNVIAIAAGVPSALGFTRSVREKAGKQYVDVGIAEQSAVALASGIAANGGKPVFGTSSTFLQRAYDQLAQDVAINKSPVTILATDASIFGMNDVTHVGFYDLAMIANIPEIVYLAPSGKEEYLAMLEWSIEQQDHPVVIRVPADDVTYADYEVRKDYGDIGRFQVTKEGESVAILAPGTFYNLGKNVAELLENEVGIAPTIINPGFVSHIDKGLLEELERNHKLVVVLEDGILEGGFSSKISQFYSLSNMKVKAFGLNKKFYDRYDYDEIMIQHNLTPKQIVAEIKRILSA